MMNTQFNTVTQPAADFRQCFNCNYEALTVNSVCPRCRKNKFFTAENIRIRGVIVTVLGLFIAVLIGAIAVFVAILLLGAAEDPSSAQRIAEGQGTLIAIYGFFALLVGLGLYFAVAGLWMLICGKRNRILVWIMWPLIALVFGVGSLISAWA